MVPLCSTTPYKEYSTLVFSSATFFKNEQKSKVSSSPIYTDAIGKTILNYAEGLLTFENAEVLSLKWTIIFSPPFLSLLSGITLMFLLESYHCSCPAGRTINQGPPARITVSWPRYLDNWTWQSFFRDLGSDHSEYLNNASSYFQPKMEAFNSKRRAFRSHPRPPLNVFKYPLQIWWEGHATSQELTFPIEHGGCLF